MCVCVCVCVRVCAPAPAPAPAPASATGLPMSTLPKFLEFDRKVRDCRLRKHATRLCGPSRRAQRRRSAPHAVVSQRHGVFSPICPAAARARPPSPRDRCGSPEFDRFGNEASRDGRVFFPFFLRARPATCARPDAPPPNLRHQVLRWNAFFKEAVTESAIENHRVRKCVIYMYLEDESVYVGEPRQPNSGIPQGSFLKRHRIPVGDTGAFFGVGDIHVGETVTFYGRSFFVVSCDAFTRAFLEARGLAPAEDQPFPDEPIEAYRATLKKDTVAFPYPPAPRNDVLAAYIEASNGAPSHLLVADKLEKFLANDRKVLRFFCVWDDRGALYGEKRPFVLHYYLADDSVEVLEVAEPNGGRDPFPVFLRRQPLPNEKMAAEAAPGAARSTSNVTHLDLRLGGTVNVYGREFLIHDADAFTKRWYVENEGFDMTEDFPEVHVHEPSAPIPQNAVPPYNGFGGLADSLQNCVALIPKPVRPDFDKQMTYTDTVLRFKARICKDETGYSRYTPTESDEAREFIVSVYLANDTVAVFEPPDRKKQIVGGKFLERQECLKPNSPEKYEATDCFAGARLILFSRCFELVEADGYTYGFMEQHGPSFPRSDVKQVVARLRSLLAGREAAARAAFGGAEKTDAAGLQRALTAAGVEVVKQECVTLFRHLAGGADAVDVKDACDELGIADTAKPTA